MLTVSNYHYIRESFKSDFPSIFGITPAEFKSQLRKLKNTGDFISPNDFVLNHQELLCSKENFYLITFDDGLREQYDFALPILDNLNAAAIFFANSQNFEEEVVSVVHKIHLIRSVIDAKKLLEKIRAIVGFRITESEIFRASKIYIYDDSNSAMLKYVLNFKLEYKEQQSVVNKIFQELFDEKVVFEKLYMTNHNLVHLSAEGYLGSHSHTHIALGLLNEVDIFQELIRSKQYFETLTNSDILFVSYPYGTSEAVTDNVIKIAKKANYAFGFTTERGINNEMQNPLLLKRFDCNDLVGGKNYK